ncbi:MAG TPA: hypothetical protein VG125_11045 [Pirellulales bacterium]|jgi:hypothetical protein|nr:hypothetical protein [Pirellulales bacterium]
MMPLDEALAQISDIRGHLARTEIFRGYRAATIGFSAIVAVGAAGLQAALIPAPAHAARDYLVLWIGAAAFCLIVTAIEMSVRCARTTSPLAIRHACLAAEQFLPCVVAGALLTAAMFRYAGDALWMLPGLWSILFSLGIFASWRLLPRQTFWVAVYYLLAGVFCLAAARGDYALSPWAMVGTFGIGQALAAAILYHTLERSHERT